MDSRPLEGPVLLKAALVVTAILAAFPSLLFGSVPTASPLTLVNRIITQDQGAWIIDYRLRNGSSKGVVVTPDEISLKLEGWVSNSRVASHAVPRWSSLVVLARVDPTAFSDVIHAVDESQRCRERLTVSIWAEGRSSLASGSVGKTAGVPAATAPSTGAAIALVPLSLAPGEMMHLRLRLDHQHILYGDFDPLLGIRAIKLTVGRSTYPDVLPLDREQYLAYPKFTWPEPPEERRDTRHFVSAPDSLHIEADVPGHQSYRFQERPVRYNSKMKLKFWYLIAAGTDGECRVRRGTE